MRTLLLVFGSALLLSCGSAAKCTTSTCTGCCDANDTCQAGTVETDCGKGGTLCVACPSGQLCTSNACATKVMCTPANCAGCCSNTDGKCYAGTGNDTCGSGGAQCAVCVNHQMCISKACGCNGSDTGATCTMDSACCSGHCDGVGFTAGTCRAP